MSAIALETPVFRDISDRRQRMPANFILLALLLHLLLLGIPSDQEPLPAPPLEVALQFETPLMDIAPEPLILPQEPVEMAVPDQDEAPDQVTPATPARADNQEAALTPAPAGLPVEPQQEPVPDLVRAELLEAVARMDWGEPEKSQGLARETHSETLQRLARPVLPGQSNAFDGMTAPSEVEIMDRWLEPGGAQRVVIRTPDGKTYCGRQEAMDAMRPWLTMPMMFHGCGGGGKRSGNQDWRNN